MKKILILGGASVHCKLIETAKRMGCYTIVTDYLADSPGKKIADESWMLNIMDVDAIVEKCRKERIDAVISGWLDPCQRPYCEICEKLELPCYGTKEQFYKMTDKHAFKKMCVENGIDIIPEYSENDIEHVEYPAFVKPVDSRGSRGQSVCGNYTELVAAIEKAKSESSNKEVVIEKYMEGKHDFSMTYFVIDGIPHLTRVCDRYLGKREDGLNKQCIGCIAPSKYTKLYLERVDQRVKTFISRLGIKFGPVFMQGFVDGDTVRFYDPGLRFPGGDYELFLREATGVDFMELIVEFALTGKIDKEIGDDLYNLNNMHTIQLDFTCRGGKIADFRGIQEIMGNPRVVSSFGRYKPGETVPKSGDVRQRVYEVGMLINADERVVDSVKEIQSVFDVLDENGESMLISSLDPALLTYN